MAYPNSVIVGIYRGTLFGQSVVNRLVWAHEDMQSDADSMIAAEAMYDIWTDAWKDTVHASYLLNTIEAGVWQTPSSANSPTVIKFVNEQGTITATDAMPSYVTVGLIKMPDNAAKEPSTVDDFRKGYMRVSGVAEGQTAFGLLTSAAATSYGALAGQIHTLNVDFGSGSLAYVLQIDRYSPTGDNPLCPVASVLVPYKTGSQNTRKF